MSNTTKWTSEVASVSILSLSLALTCGLVGSSGWADDLNSRASTTKNLPVETGNASSKSIPVENSGKASSSIVNIHKAAPDSLESKEMQDYWKSLLSNRRLMLDPGQFIVPTDTIETANNVRIESELPGIDPHNIDISVGENTVTIKGTKRIDTSQKADDFRRLERAYGTVEKTIILPAPVDPENATASLRDGVLSITLPKHIETKAERKISSKREKAM